MAQVPHSTPIRTHAPCQAESYPVFLLKAEGCSLLLPLSEGAALWLVLTSSVAEKQECHQ